MVEKLFEELCALDEVEALALGGSRAGEHFDKASDYDVYLYCSEPIPEDVRRDILSKYCSVMEIGNHFWEYEDNCRLSNGIDIDLLYRDLDAFTADVAETKAPHHVPADSELVTALLAAYTEETGEAAVKDGTYATIGGMITEKKIKYTKNEKVMAFLQVEDLVGSVEVIVFPRDYEKYGSAVMEDSKVFIRGRVSVEEDKDAKLVCEQITTFEQMPKKLWIKFPTKEAYESRKDTLFDILRESEGKDNVVIYVENPKAMNPLPANWNVSAQGPLIERLEAAFGAGNVKVV